MLENKYLSRIEMLRFDALSRFVTVKDAATSLGIEPQTLYNWLWQLRRKYKQRHGWCNSIISQRNRSELIASLLCQKKPLVKPTEIEEEDESKVDEFMQFAERQEQEKEEEAEAISS